MTVTAESLNDATSRALELIVRRQLTRYGLGELTSWALRLVSENASEARYEAELEDQPAFRERFSAMFQRRNQIRRGSRLPPISVDEILQYEKQVAELESFYGYPPGTLGDPQQRLVDDVGYNELQALVAAEEAFLASDPGSQEVFRQFYAIGATRGELVAAAINQDMGVPLLQQRIQAANVASESVVAGFGDLTREESESLVSRGVDEGGAREAFSLLARSRQLTDNFSREELINLAAGDAPAVQRFERSQRGAVGIFSGGGGYAGGTAGLA